MNEFAYLYCEKVLGHRTKLPSIKQVIDGLQENYKFNLNLLTKDINDEGVQIINYGLKDIFSLIYNCLPKNTDINKPLTRDDLWDPKSEFV